MSHSIHTHLASIAVSKHNSQKLLAKIASSVPSVLEITGRYEHYLDVTTLSKPALTKINELLTYGEPYTAQTTTQTCVIVPRFGTISPWSSKATDIFHNAGLTQVQRVERGIRYFITSSKPLTHTEFAHVASYLHDPMTEVALIENIENQLRQLFTQASPKPLSFITISKDGREALETANVSMGLALSADEIDYLYTAFHKLKRDPTDAEIMMFSLVNSEHCRHKVFNANWTVDQKSQPKSLFGMIRNTYEHNSSGILSAYSDNGAVLAGRNGDFFLPDKHNIYRHNPERAHIVIKVETHNHPTAIAPIPGAATGSGGEIRDEGATGRGAKPKAGLSGFSVSHLRIPGAVQPWEQSDGTAPHLATPLQIMIEGPVGGAAFNNEFGRPNILGYFRSYEQHINDVTYGYHKPIMLAGGLANIRASLVQKQPINPGDLIVILGGPAMLVGLGGGSASSKAIGQQNASLDFASVQRHNPEMQRRAQEVINHCVAAESNPIVSIHDIGAGGYSNAVSEIVHDNGLGAVIDLRAIHNADLGMSPLEIWTNEAQERYVVAIRKNNLQEFEAYCKRERCPYAVIGTATKQSHIRVRDTTHEVNVIDANMDTFFGKPPKMERGYKSQQRTLSPIDLSTVKLDEAVKRVLMHPTVGSKSFLITIGDRTVGGMTVRDQMAGPWQIPVADAAVTANSFDGYAGEAMAIGERTPLALHDPASSGRMAVGEMITNIASTDIAKLSDIKLSANWMAAVGTEGGDQALYETVRAVGEEFCPALDLTIPVGKDSTSMKVRWDENGSQHEVVSPLSLIVSGFAPVGDVRQSLTPQLQNTSDTVLMAVPLSSKQRLGGSILAQVYRQTGNQCPDADPKRLKLFFNHLKQLKRQAVILAYHDRSDGGFLATLCEMAFASRIGLNIQTQTDDPLRELFCEELGVIVQIKARHKALICQQFNEAYQIATLESDDTIRISSGATELFSARRSKLQSWWSHTSHLLARLRDNSSSADSEFATINADDPGLSPQVTFPVKRRRPKHLAAPPKVAILREQGVNGQIEMAAAFTRAGFDAVDVHMSDLLSGKRHLDEFAGLAACGGFSYGDVLGAGRGWAQTILQNAALKTQFKDFFERTDSFSLGVCNGCQMLSELKAIIPGADSWPTFLRNESEQFEARLVTVEITDSPSILLQGMTGSRLLVPTAHGEGRAFFQKNSIKKAQSCVRYVDNIGQTTTQYPYNPNGSPFGITGLTTSDGRATILMPHPERAFRNIQYSWKPDDWNSEDSPWMKLFDNAYQWSTKK